MKPAMQTYLDETPADQLVDGVVFRLKDMLESAPYEGYGRPSHGGGPSSLSGHDIQMLLDMLEGALGKLRA